jgi:hypothetical protein
VILAVFPFISLPGAVRVPMDSWPFEKTALRFSKCVSPWGIRFRPKNLVSIKKLAVQEPDLFPKISFPNPFFKTL